MMLSRDDEEEEEDIDDDDANKVGLGRECLRPACCSIVLLLLASKETGGPSDR